MNVSSRTTVTSEEYVRPRAALATIKRYCDEMVAQEKSAAKFHTLMAVDSDVVHMAAFPLENLTLGSVFHAWQPLRELARQVTKATREQNASARLSAIEEIFERDAARIPLLTTLALSEYIFRWRAPDDGFKSYAILPPHEHEWGATRRQARNIATEWHDTLPDRVQASDISRIIGENWEAGDIADRLLDQMPETLSILFPSQIRTDHADRTLYEFELGGIVAKLDKFPKGLPHFDKVIDSTEAKFVQAKIFEFLYTDATRSPVLQKLTERNQHGAVERIKKTLEGDARVLTWLQQVNLSPGNQISLELDGLKKNLRAILITASARVWRAARKFGLAEACLRSPIAYLGEGRFFDWAFKGLINEENELFANLRRGRLSQWLEPLVAPREHESTGDRGTGYDTAYLSCVHEWERLMSHLATSLNLASPTSGLQKAIAEAASGNSGRKLVDDLTVLLSKKIVDVTLRLSRTANETGLRSPALSTTLQRNLPPVMLNRYPGAEVVLAEIRVRDLADEQERNQLIERIISLKSEAPTGQSDHVARDYLQTVLMSLLWMRLGQWAKARDVVRSAVGFALEVEEKALTVNVAVEPSDIRGDEALYLLAVSGRLAARSVDDITEAHAALRVAELLRKERDLRFVAENESQGVAEILFSKSSEATTGGLGALRLDLILQLFDNDEWAILRQPWRAQSPHENADILAGGSYADFYALQQMYCAILMRYMLAYAPLQGLPDNTGNPRRASVTTIFDEFVRFAGACKSDDSACVADSATSRQVRNAFQCWTNPSMRDEEAGNSLRQEFRKLLQEEDENGISGMDQRRTEWMYHRLAKGWLI